MMERVVLSREELFERVWNTPVSKLAHEFGISDVALSKLCRRRGVPVPPRGYWAKLAVGQRLQRPELPVVPLENQRPAVLYRHLVRAREREVDATGAPRLHPVADRVRKALLLGKPGVCGRVAVNQSGLPFVLASPRQATKVAELLDTLISEAERKGIDIVRNGVEGDPLEFRRGKQAAHICIEEELRPRSTGTSDVLVPSGRLVLRLALDWRQTEDRPPEELLVSLISRLDHCLCSVDQ